MYCMYDYETVIIIIIIIINEMQPFQLTMLYTCRPTERSRLTAVCIALPGSTFSGTAVTSAEFQTISISRLINAAVSSLLDY